MTQFLILYTLIGSILLSIAVLVGKDYALPLRLAIVAVSVVVAWLIAMAVSREALANWRDVARKRPQ